MHYRISFPSTIFSVYSVEAADESEAIQRVLEGEADHVGYEDAETDFDANLANVEIVE